MFGSLHEAHQSPGEIRGFFFAYNSKAFNILKIICK